MYQPGYPPCPGGYPSAPTCPPAYDDVGFQPQPYPPHGTPVAPTGYVPGQPASSAHYVPPSSVPSVPSSQSHYVPGQPSSHYVPGQGPSAVPAYPGYPASTRNTSSGGIFGGIGRTIGSVAGTIVSEIDQLSRGDSIITQLRPRNIVQLYTREHGTAIEIVSGPYGLVVDSRGPLSPHAYHAHWVVYKENGNIISFSNNNNYLAVVSGNVCVIQNAGTPMVKFRAKQWDKGIYFESVGTPGHYLHVTKDGNALKLKEGLHNGTVFFVQVVHEPR